MHSAAGILIADFVGKVQVRSNEPRPLQLLLQGATRAGRGEVLLLAFSRGPGQEIPDCLTDAQVRQVEHASYAICAAEGRWTIEGTKHFPHRDVGAAFYRAVPPVKVPWSRRALWRLILIAARLPL